MAEKVDETQVQDQTDLTGTHKDKAEVNTLGTYVS